ncbi:hypothetical protein [Streptomyces sp. NPDC088812]
MFWPVTVTEFGRPPAGGFGHGSSHHLMPCLTQCRVVDFGRIKSTSCR